MPKNHGQKQIEGRGSAHFGANSEKIDFSSKIFEKSAKTGYFEKFWINIDPKMPQKRHFLAKKRKKCVMCTVFNIRRHYGELYGSKIDFREFGLFSHFFLF